MPPSNIVLVLADSMRTRNVSCYGYERRTTPRLDALAAEGARFANAFVQAPFTVSSVASILTGVYPSAHGLQHYGERLSDKLTTLPEQLQAAGYYTAAFVANPHINADSGLTRGFTYFTDGRPWYKRPRSMSRLVSWAENGRALNRHVERQLRTLNSQPFFFFVFYNDSHIPFSDLPRLFLPLVGGKFHSPDFETVSYSAAELARVVDLYDASQRRADRYIGQLYDIVQRMSQGLNTTFLISADHGEGLDGRFERAGHGRLYDSGIHVPLIISGTGISSPGAVVSEMVASLDLAPTVCELAGIDAAVQFQGTSLVPFIDQDASRPSHPYVVSEYHDSRSVRTAQWKLIQRGAGIGMLDSSDTTEIELYDVQRDSWEEENVAGQHPDVVAELSGLLAGFVADIAASVHSPSAFEEDEAVIERLRGLGYVI